MLSKIIIIIAILLVLIVWCILFGPVHVPLFKDERDLLDEDELEIMLDMLEKETKETEENESTK